MNKYFVFISFMLGVFLSALPARVQAEDSYTDSTEAVFVEFVNHARNNAAQAIADAGFDPEEAARANPYLGKVMQSSLPPLSISQELSDAALLHAGEMLENGYYSSVSPDGVSPEERIMDQGYLPVISGDLLGIITFTNFISNEESLRKIFLSFLMDEVHEDAVPVLFSPDYRDIGSGFVSGQMRIGGSIMDVSLLVCYLGTSREHMVGSHLHRKINLARVKPAQAFFDAGVSLNFVRYRWGWDPRILDRLDPMASDGDFSSLASACLQEILDDPFSALDYAYADMARVCGFEPDPATGKEFFLIPLDAGLDETDDLEAARLIYFRLLMKEALSRGPAHILQPDYDTIGIAVQFVSAKNSPRFERDMLAALVLTSRQADDIRYVFGNIYIEFEEEDGTLSRQARSGVQVSILDFWTEDLRSSTLTDITGLYRLPVESEHMTLVIETRDGSAPVWFYLPAGGGNVLIDQVLLWDTPGAEH